MAIEKSGPSVLERAGALRLLARMLSSPLDAGELRSIANLQAGDNTFSPAVAQLAEVAGQITPERAAQDFQRLFIGIGGGELTPYASHYLAGALHDLPLVELRQDMRRMGQATANGISEPEDHAATILEIAASLVDGSLAADPVPTAQFFRAHVLFWLPRFFADLADARSSRFYSVVGSLGAAVTAEEQRMLSKAKMAPSPGPYPG